MFISVHICKFVDDFNFNFLKVKEKPPRVLGENEDLDESNS